MPSPLPPPDLDAILAATAPLWLELRRQRLFLTGGTGFFGCWLVESFLHINRVLALDARLTVLTRNPEAFLRRLPHLRHNPSLTLLEGDIRSFDFPSEPHSHLLHAAADSTAPADSAVLQQTIVAGTARILAFAAATGARRLLFTSSGAVYGPQPPTHTHIPESFPPSPQTAYALAKLDAENLCLAAGRDTGLEVVIARCFAFLGPHLPLDAHFAAGNFLADALGLRGKDRTIRIASDGRAVRSYLYASDLAIWLWTMLLQAPSQTTCNAGSEHAVTIRELAETVRRVIDPRIDIEVALAPDPSRPAHRYVPSTALARARFGLLQTVSLDDALRRTAAWHTLKSV